MIKKKIFSKKNKKDAKATNGKITKDTIEDYRKEIISEGRKFKYPMQYSKNKLVLHAIIISLSALIIITLFFVSQLYISQNTGTIFYRVSQIIPFPVASVDGQQVRFSDYLMRFRSEKHYLQTKENTDFSTKDGQRQADGIQRQSMDDAVADAFAAKIAREKNIVVTRKDAQDYIATQQNPGDTEISDQTLISVLQDYYGWSLKEYEHMIQKKLLTQKVRYAVDDTARKVSNDVFKAIGDAEKSFEEVAASFGENKVQFGGSGGLVPNNNRDGGLASLALSQDVGQVSKPSETTTGDAYYIIKTTGKTADSVSYEYIKIPLTEFDTKLSALRKDDKVNYFISIKDANDEEE